jgi:hypothetical protein
VLPSGGGRDLRISLFDSKLAFLTRSQEVFSYEVPCLYNNSLSFNQTSEYSVIVPSVSISQQVFMRGCNLNGDPTYARVYYGLVFSCSFSSFRLLLSLICFPFPSQALSKILSGSRVELIL